MFNAKPWRGAKNCNVRNVIPAVFNLPNKKSTTLFYYTG
ncbi:hypothetical protein AOR13_3776 [Alteromonas stellipolaris LMG 21856]|nr:hypothetical protein AOR13_3776 [Alteromonas stellipolaris LMG 21856]